jgi:hypothetical protein
VVEAKHIQLDHIAALASLTPDYALALSREIFAAQIRAQAQAKGVFVTRMESLEAVFAAEANAVNAGAAPKIDFFLPLSTELPFSVARV